jgi:diaminopimelate decarboxylase
MSLRVEDWGFATGADGGLTIGGVAAASLAAEFGTPLTVIDEAGLAGRAARLRRAFEDAYPGPVTVHYALKCNNTPAVVRMVLDQGLWPEVSTAFEWALSRRLGVAPERIVANGPHKGELLPLAVAEGAGLVVADGLSDLAVIEGVARAAGARVPVLLRVNPGCTPKGMNRATATGSRKLSVFGLDPVSGEVEAALDRVARSPAVAFRGFHCHVGTGVRREQDYGRPLAVLAECARRARDRGLATEVLDVGGGFGVPLSRELTTREFLLYQAVGWSPAPPDPARFPPIESFARFVSRSVVRAWGEQALPLPRLVVEPGRAIASAAGALLVRIGAVKQRAGVGTWLIADGGAATVAFPLYYEYHEMFLCRAPAAPPTRRYRVVGPGCFSADWLCRDKALPPAVPGDVLAICDAGAYFTVQESNFGFPRPAMVGVRDGGARLLRRRESFEDMVARDLEWESAREESGHAA